MTARLSRSLRGVRAHGWAFALPLLALFMLAACDSPEEKEAQHLARGIAFYDEGNDTKSMLELRNVMRINPKNADAMYYAGLIHERGQRWQQAFVAYQGAAAEKPDMIKAQVKLGTLLLLSNELPGTLTAADAIEKVSPGDPDALSLRGAVALRQGDTQKALDLAKAALAKNPDHENSLGVYAGVLQRLGEVQRAVTLVDEAIARRPQSSSLRLLKIGLLEKSADKVAIRKAYDELIAFDPKNEDYRLALANFLQADQDTTGAEKVLRETLNSEIGTARSTSFLVQLLRRSGGFEAADVELRRQIERKPSDWVLRFTLADLNLRENKPDIAEQELRIIVERAGEDPAALDAKAALAQLALTKNDLAGAKKLTEEVLTETAEHRGAKFVRALVALRGNQTEEAIRYGRTALRRDPNWTPALKLVAEAHVRRNEQDLAIGALNDVIAADPSDAEAAQALATLLTQRGDYDAALKTWDLVLQRATDKSQALASKAQIAIRQQNWTAAQSDIDALLEIPTQQAQGALLAGSMMVAQNRFEQGREWFSKAQSLAPNAPEPVIGVVRTFVAENKLDEAVTYLDTYTDANPKDAIAFNMMGELAARRSDLERARTAYAKAIELQPGWLTPRRQLGALLLANGKSTEAIDTLQTANTAIPNNVELLNDLATVMFTTGRPKDAIAIYERVIAIDPNSEVGINNLAALVADHDHENAAALDRALSLATRFRTSTNPLFLDTLGWLNYRKGDHAVAATYLERAVNIAGDRADLRYHLGMALARGGQKERALIELRKAVAPGVPDYQGIDEARSTLAQLEADLSKPAAPAGSG